MIVDADEALLEVGSDSPHWSGPRCSDARDPGTGAFLVTRMAVRPDRGVRTAGMLVWFENP